MSESLSQRVAHEARAFIYGPIYPFLQPDWLGKMWIFAALSYVPFVNVIIARGWRMEYVHRLGWGYERVLPRPQDALRFLKNGVLLWLAHGFFLLIPIILIAVFGLGGWGELWRDAKYFFGLNVDYFIRGLYTTGEYLSQLWSFAKNELFETLLVILIENVYLVVYVPIYRIGMIRFSLTDRLFRSHLAVIKNLRFLFKHLVDIALMYAFYLFNFVLILAVDVLLAATVVGIPLIPIVTVYLHFWNSGYEYGLLARLMAEGEAMPAERYVRPDPAPAFAIR